MHLLEIFDPNDYEGFRTEKEDNTTLKFSDLRKTKLTLAQLNRLRIMNDVRKLEHEEKLTTLKTQYKAAPDETGMPAM